MTRDQEIERVRDLRADGWTFREIGEELGMSKDTARDRFRGDRERPDKLPEHMVTRPSNQRMAALEAANRIRIARAKIKRQLRSREVTIQEILDKPPIVLRTARVIEILSAVPRFGPVRARKIMSLAGIHEGCCFAWLSDKRRQDLIDVLPDPDPAKVRRLIGQGMTRREVGERLNLQPNRVKELA